jgi:hypothetical protein
MLTRSWFLIGLGLALCAVAACAEPQDADGEPDAEGVVFAYPVDQQVDVPLGTRIVVSFSQPVDPTSVHLVGPDGPVAAIPSLAAGGTTVIMTPAELEAGASYAVVVDPAPGPLLEFTTRDDRPRSGPPLLLAVNGAAPDRPDGFRPLVESSTLQLVFSEPLDPRSVAAGPGGIELIDVSTGSPVPCRLFASRIHAAVDPLAPLEANRSYQLRLGAQLRDLSGEPLEATEVELLPVDGLGRGTVDQTLRLRQDGDPVAAIARLDLQNQIEISHPLIGRVSSAMMPSALLSTLGDPAVLGGPIAFTIPRGQRLSSSSMDILLGGEIPSGLTTGEVIIEILADSTGRLTRNRFRADEVLPDNQTSPVHVDLALDVGLFATDPTGNAVLAQTVLGVQMAGVAMADEGRLALELHGTIDVDLHGIAQAPANLVLALVSDPTAAVEADGEPPSLAGKAGRELSPDDGIDLQLTEPVDIDRASAGGIVLLDRAGREIPASIEVSGSAVTVRPREPLPGGAKYRLELREVADVAGNLMPAAELFLSTPAVTATDAPLSVVAASPGTACARTGMTTELPGRCAGGLPSDDDYRAFSLAAGGRVDVAFDQPADPGSLILGSACGDGSVRVEHIDAMGTCLGAVAGSLVPRRRGLSFVPDEPWAAGEHYRVLLVSGPDGACGAGEICGMNGAAGSFDPLSGKTASASGGPDLLIDFVGAPPDSSTRLYAELSPYPDTNASGRLEEGEDPPRTNRAALRITGTSGVITSAEFSGPDCVPGTPEREACMYMLGTMPADLRPVRRECPLPDGTTAAACIPVGISAQQMYTTSVAMTAGAVGIPIATETGIGVMRVREPAVGVEGFIVDRGGTPTMVVALDLYMDAPDMALPIGEHDMHSKELSVLLSGPVQFRPDGRIAIELSNQVDVPIAITIAAPLGLAGQVSLVVPAGQMKLQLLSRRRRSVR